MQVLIIIDWQKDFVELKDSPVFIPSAAGIANNLAGLVRDFRVEMPIIHVLTRTVAGDVHPFKQGRNREYCVAGTPGAEPASPNLIEPQDRIIYKTRYSAFYKTDLRKVLLDMSVRKIYFAGLTTTTCISSTLREAYCYGFENFLVEDCATSTIAELDRAEKAIISRSFAVVLDRQSAKKSLSENENLKCHGSRKLHP